MRQGEGEEGGEGEDAWWRIVGWEGYLAGGRRK